jgi:hypothetical protein
LFREQHLGANVNDRIEEAETTVAGTTYRQTSG